MIQSTNGSNGNWSNLMIIYSFNVDIPVWECIDDSEILTGNPSISTPVNQWLTMCAVLGGHVDKWGVNLKI